MSGAGADGERPWPSHVGSLPEGLRLAASSLGGELARARSFFLDPATPAAPAPRSGGPVGAPDDADATTRLEVMSVPEINFSVLSLYGASLLALVYVLLVTHAARESWEEAGALVQGRAWDLVSKVLRVTLNTVFFALPLLYALRLATARKVVTEQVWTLCLLSAGLFFENPLTDLFYSFRTLRHAGDQPLGAAGQKPLSARHHAASLVLYDATYTVVVYSYLLLSAHSYRVLDSRKYSRRFYLPKLVAAITYFGVKLALGYSFRIALGLVPFARLLSLYYLLLSGRRSVRLVFPIVLTTIVDVALMVWVMREVRKTARFLARVPYLENRSKQLGFRCFVYQTLMLIFNLVLVAVVLEANLPRGVLDAAYDWAVDPAYPHRYIQLEAPVGQLGLALVYITWNIIIAYVNLPPGPIMPYTVTALHSLALSVLPTAVTARHRWPVWLPGHLPREPDYIDDSSDDEIELDELLPESLAGSAEVLLPRSRSTGLIGVAAPMLSLDEAAAAAAADFAQTAQAEVSWRAGIPRGEQCPLRYRHREWHEGSGGTAVGSTDLPPAALRLSFANVDPTYSGENVSRVGVDDLLSGTRIREALPFETDAAGSLSGLGSYRVGPRLGIGSDQTLPVDVPAFSSRWSEAQSPNHDSDGNAEMYSSLSHMFSPPPTSSLPPVHRRRLITRKNLFVMETQVTLANAMYMCYIPGNKLEERPKHLTVSENDSGAGGATDRTDLFAEGLDELGSQLERENLHSLKKGTSAHADLPVDHRPSQPMYPAHDYGLEHDLGTHDSGNLQRILPVPEVTETERQPDHDDGSMFLVDPEEMAAKHGYLLYRHVRHDASNGHAIILVGQDRVIVAFSGTRDAKNWVTNSRFMRAPWDEMFQSFASEPSDLDPDAATDPTAPAKPEGSRAVDRSRSADRGDLTAGMDRDRGSDPRLLADSLQSRSRGALLDYFRKDSPRRHSASVTALAEKNTLDAADSGVESPLAPRLNRSYDSSHVLRRSRSEEQLISTERDPLLAPEIRTATRVGYGSARRLRVNRGSQRVSRSGSFADHQGPRGRALSGQRRNAAPGVSEIEDMAASLAQEFVTYGQAKVHLGFAQAYGKLRNRVLGALLELYGGPRSAGDNDSGNLGGSSVGDGPGFDRDLEGRVCGVVPGSCHGLPLFLTGHSLGGVLASFCSYESARWYRRIGLRRRQDVACTTFGSPMPGNSVFKQRYERMVETHWRFEFACDPIAALPGVLNYEPVGVRALLDPAGWLMIDPSIVESKWWGRLVSPMRAQRLHFRASYFRALAVVCRRHRSSSVGSGGSRGSHESGNDGCEDGSAECRDGSLDDRFWPFPIECQVLGLFPDQAAEDEDVN